MSENKVRTVDSIHQEYTQLCARAGHLQYQINAIGKDLALVNEQLRDLNLEASSLQAAKPAEAPAAEAPAAEAPALVEVK